MSSEQIREILERHGVHDEKLANALAEILELNHREVDKYLGDQTALKKSMRG